MSTTNPPNLGVIISSEKIRRVIYAIYVVAIIVAGATQVAYAAGGDIQPQWLTQALAVLTYLGVPVGGLALANTANAPVAVVEAVNDGDTGFRDSVV